MDRQIVVKKVGVAILAGVAMLVGASGAARAACAAHFGHRNRRLALCAIHAVWPFKVQPADELGRLRRLSAAGL